MFRWSNPRRLIRESPYPPPCLVAYTPGVEFIISGNSKFPTFKAISLAVIVDTAIGVSRTFATSITPDVRITSSNVSADTTKDTTIPSCAITSCPSYPRYVIIRTSPAFAVSIVNTPSKLVTTPLLVPFTRMVAPGNGSLPSASTTFPLICAKVIIDDNIIKLNNNSFFIIVSSFLIKLNITNCIHTNSPY